MSVTYIPKNVYTMKNSMFNIIQKMFTGFKNVCHIFLNATQCKKCSHIFFKCTLLKYVCDIKNMFTCFKNMFLKFKKTVYAIYKTVYAI